MHCPRCGQQQISEQTKFCSRCGFLMSVVADVVAHGGSLPQLDALNAGSKKWLTRKNGMGFSLLWFLFFLLIMTPFWGIVGVEELAGMSAILAIFGGLMIFLFSAIFLEGKQKPAPAFYSQPQVPQYNPQQHPAQHHQQQQMGQPQMGGQHYQPNALPPQQAQPVQSYTPPPPHVAGSWRDTNDLIREQSMEDKTKMLSREEENNR